jgi:hypothetical protein
VSVARLADGARVPKGDQRVVVARVVISEYLPAERLIADLGDQVGTRPTKRAFEDRGSSECPSASDYTLTVGARVRRR